MMPHAQEKATRLGMVAPNSCGQGQHADHARAPYAWRLPRLGWIYSHSTFVVHGDRDVLHHTFRQGQHAVSFWRDPRTGWWKWAAGWCGSGRHVVAACIDVEPLLRYLRGVRYRARKAGKEGFSP